MFAITALLVLAAQSPPLETGSQVVSPAAATNHQEAPPPEEAESSKAHRMLLVASGAAIPLAGVSVLVGLGALVVAGGLAGARVFIPAVRSQDSALLAGAGLATSVAFFGLISFVVCVVASVGLLLLSRIIP